MTPHRSRAWKADPEAIQAADDFFEENCGYSFVLHDYDCSEYFLAFSDRLGQVTPASAQYSCFVKMLQRIPVAVSEFAEGFISGITINADLAPIPTPPDSGGFGKLPDLLF